MTDILNTDGQKRAIDLFNYIVRNAVIAHRRGLTSDEVQGYCEQVAEMMDGHGITRGVLIVVLGTMLLTYLDEYDKMERSVTSLN